MITAVAEVIFVRMCVWGGWEFAFADFLDVALLLCLILYFFKLGIHIYWNFIQGNPAKFLLRVHSPRKDIHLFLPATWNTS